jgi:hypothetical protein
MIIWTVVFAALTIAGFGLVAYAFTARQRLRELAVKERIAMIEKGLMPAPERDPARFERLVGARRRTSSRGTRYRSAGVVLMGLGLAMIVLLTFAAEAVETGLGVGGGLAVLGAAMFVNGLLLARDEPDDFSAQSLDSRSTEPPPNVGP